MSTNLFVAAVMAVAGPAMRLLSRAPRYLSGVCMATLRSYVFLDSLQPQVAAHISTTCKGYFPVPGVA